MSATELDYVDPQTFLRPPQYRMQHFWQFLAGPFCGCHCKKGPLYLGPNYNLFILETPTCSNLNPPSQASYIRDFWSISLAQR